MPPPLVSSFYILPLLQNPVEGVLGDLQILLRVSTSRNKEGNYLYRHRIMSPSQRRGILFIAESSNVAQEPTGGQRNRWMGPLSEGRSLDDWMLEQRHGWNSG